MDRVVAVSISERVTGLPYVLPLQQDGLNMAVRSLFLDFADQGGIIAVLTVEQSGSFLRYDSAW